MTLQTSRGREPHTASTRTKEAAMLEILFTTGQTISALVMIYGVYLAIGEALQGGRSFSL
jgi:hypothetical protein